jgi:hypothetical protein
MKIQVPFQQLLTIVKTLTPGQKAKLRAELNGEQVDAKQQDDFIEYLLNGPVYSKKDIDIVEKNIKSIATWRAKN